MNFGRPQFVRDLMVANGDAHKPIWISEMGWNAVPDDVPDKRFGQVTLEQQARHTPQGYERIRGEWPWWVSPTSGISSARPMNGRATVALKPISGLLIPISRSKRSTTA